MKILIVDDLKQLRSLLTDILEKTGYTDLQTAASGPQALEVLKKSVAHRP